jgi:hypothetical protein
MVVGDQVWCGVVCNSIGRSGGILPQKTLYFSTPRTAFRAFLGIQRYIIL